MFVKNDNVASHVALLAGHACQELFEAYGVTLTPSNCTRLKPDELQLSGVMGFLNSAMRGTCLLIGNQATVAASCPAGESLRDWMGELTNQLVGRLKTKLLGCGVELSLTTPIAMSGVRLEPLPRCALEVMSFACATGSVMALLELETIEDFALGAERPASHGEGDVLYF